MLMSASDPKLTSGTGPTDRISARISPHRILLCQGASGDVSRNCRREPVRESCSGSPACAADLIHRSLRRRTSQARVASSPLHPSCVTRRPAPLACLGSGCEAGILGCHLRDRTRGNSWRQLSCPATALRGPWPSDLGRSGFHVRGDVCLSIGVGGRTRCQRPLPTHSGPSLEARSRPARYEMSCKRINAVPKPASWKIPDENAHRSSPSRLHDACNRRLGWGRFPESPRLARTSDHRLLR